MDQFVAALGGLFLEPGLNPLFSHLIALGPKRGVVLDLLAHLRVEDDGDLVRPITSGFRIEKCCRHTIGAALVPQESDIALASRTNITAEIRERSRPSSG